MPFITSAINVRSIMQPKAAQDAFVLSSSFLIYLFKIKGDASHVCSRMLSFKMGFEIYKKKALGVNLI